MTSEIVIMNKEAIALAADSAETLGDGTKTWQSANKIFTISKHSPVSIMVYGSSDFMGVPWETIVKMYRSLLDRRSFPTLQGYMEDFLDFLKSAEGIFPASACDEFFLQSVRFYYEEMLEEIGSEVDSILDSCTAAQEERSISEKRFLDLVFQIIQNHFNGWTESDYFDGYGKKDLNKLLRKYRKGIEHVVDQVFEKIPLEENHRNQLMDIATSIFYKDYNWETNLVSGIVMTGFGDDEVFPSLHTVLVQGLINGNLPIIRKNHTEINRNRTAVIIPFAQREMVDTFMEGVHPDFMELVSSLLEKMVKTMPGAVIEEVEGLDSKQKQDAISKVESMAPQMLDDLQQEIKNYIRVHFVGNILSVVASLPKTELALMAESLVSLTSLKRRVSMQAETVSGPIDVAVISKGDGFIWIKRKHYFKPELNPHYLRR